MKLQPESKKELTRIACGTAICTAVMWVIFAALHLVGWVKFDYTVVLGSLIGAAVAIGNFAGICLVCQKVIDELHAMHPEGLDGLILSAAVSGACGSLTKIISLNYFGAVPVIKGTYDLLEKKHGSCVAVSSNVISQGIARMDIADLLNNCGDDGHHVPQCQSFLKRPADPDPVRAGNLHGSERDCSCHCFSGFRKSLRHQRHRDGCGRRYGCALKYGKSLLKGGF